MKGDLCADNDGDKSLWRQRSDDGNNGLGNSYKSESPDDDNGIGNDFQRDNDLVDKNQGIGNGK
jgi:hypothetical protein